MLLPVQQAMADRLGAGVLACTALSSALAVSVKSTKVPGGRALPPGSPSINIVKSTHVSERLLQKCLQ